MEALKFHKRIDSPKVKRHYEGLIVVSPYPVKNGLGEVPAFTQFKVEYTGVNTSMIAEPCECCGFRFHFATKKNLNSFYVLDTPDNRARLKWNEEYRPGNARYRRHVPNWPMPNPDFLFKQQKDEA